MPTAVRGAKPVPPQPRPPIPPIRLQY